ncbi:MAG: redox-sensing transcriptional repressor Rex [Chloroflexi bacterium]|nr:redox-sensing transcriptional repressor Rex [Chloroflexota bacterium]
MGKALGIPLPSLRRLPLYYRHVRRVLDRGQEVISSGELGAACAVPAAQVRKDLRYVREYGRPGIGYNAHSLARRLEEFLGLVNDKEAVLAGAGNLGRALANYPGFARYGLRIVALFDRDPAKIGQKVGDTEVLPIWKLVDLARRLHIQMGIIAVPAEEAQSVADQMIAGGIKVIWNFSPITLNVPGDVYVKNQDLAAELATLSHWIARRRREEVDGESRREPAKESER